MEWNDRVQDPVGTETKKIKKKESKKKQKQTNKGNSVLFSSRCSSRATKSSTCSSWRPRSCTTTASPRWPSTGCPSASAPSKPPKDPETVLNTSSSSSSILSLDPICGHRGSVFQSLTQTTTTSGDVQKNKTKQKQKTRGPRVQSTRFSLDETFEEKKTTERDREERAKSFIGETSW